MKAVKANKIYTIDEEQKKFYVDSGFDILDDDGNVVEYGRGKTVPYEKYAALEKENAVLKAAAAEAAQDDAPVSDPAGEPQKASKK